MLLSAANGFASHSDDRGSTSSNNRTEQTPGAPSQLDRSSLRCRGPSIMLLPVIAVFTLLSCCCGENPGVQVILTNKWLQYGKHVGAGWIQDKLRSLTFPDISGSVGLIDYTLSGTRVTRCDFPEPAVEFYQNPTGLKTSLTGLGVALAGDWSTSFGIIHDGGTFEIAIFSLSLTSVVQLGRDADGRLSAASVSCDAQVGDVDMQFHGGASWMFQPFVKFFKGHIKDMIQSRICPGVRNAVLELENQLQATKVSYDVNDVLTVDLPLTDLPVADVSSLKLGLKGEFYSVETHEEPPFVAQPFDVSEQPDYMLSVGVSEFALNSASFGYFSAGKLQALIDESMVPPQSPIHLNTSSMGMFIPQLPKMYPNLLMNLQVYATEAPMVSFQPDVGELRVRLDVKASAIEPNGTQVPLFKLNTASSFSGKMWISDMKLNGSVNLTNFTLTLASSEVGTFKTDALEQTLGAGIKMAVVLKLNKMLRNGIVLPQMKQMQLVNPVLKVEQGFLTISTDAKIQQTEGNSSFLLRAIVEILGFSCNL